MKGGDKDVHPLISIQFLSFPCTVKNEPNNKLAVVDPRGRKGPASPLWPKMSSFSCSFGKNWPNNRLAPPVWEILDPSLVGTPPLPGLGNPGSVTVNQCIVTLRKSWHWRYVWTSLNVEIIRLTSHNLIAQSDAVIHIIQTSNNSVLYLSLITSFFHREALK